MAMERKLRNTVRRYYRIITETLGETQDLRRKIAEKFGISSAEVEEILAGNPRRGRERFSAIEDHELRRSLLKMDDQLRERYGRKILLVTLGTGRKDKRGVRGRKG